MAIWEVRCLLIQILLLLDWIALSKNFIVKVIQGDHKAFFLSGVHSKVTFLYCRWCAAVVWIYTANGLWLVILFPLITASFLHFLANLTGFLALIILRPIKLRKGVVWTLEYWNATLLLDGRKWKWVGYIYTQPIPLPTPSTQLDTCKAKPCESLILWGGHVCPCWSMEVCILVCFQSSKRSNFCVSWSQSKICDP
jgi:hypothetical protein